MKVLTENSAVLGCWFIEAVRCAGLLNNIYFLSVVFQKSNCAAGPSFLSTPIQSVPNIICCAIYLHKIESFLTAETPATLNWVEWMKTCI